jgi:hypothetical protein
MLLAGPVMAEDFGKARTQPKPSPLFEAATQRMRTRQPTREGLRREDSFV